MATGVSDEARNYKAYQWLGRQGMASVLTFVGNSSGDRQAERAKNARGNWDKWKLPGYDAWYVTAPGIMQQALAMGGGGAGGAGTGGTTGSTGGGAGGVAAAAVQAGMPGYTGGGPTFSIGAVNTQAILQQRDDEFLGVDTFTPAEKLAAGYSPFAVNWDGFARIGSRCVRRGCAKLGDDHSTLSKNSALRGLSLALIPNGTDDQLELLYTFADNDIGSTRSSVATDFTVVTTTPLWGRPVTLKGWPGPKMALSDNGSQELQVVTDYTNLFSNSTQKGQRANSVVALTIRYSLTDYPRDIDGYDYVASTALTGVDRDAWTGASRTDTQTLTAAQYFLTAWAITREGVSEPSFASLTLA